MKPLARLIIAAVMLASLSLRSLPDVAITYTVTTALDNDADGCGTPPTDQCTLREAITAANAHVGIRDNIAFDIPGGGVQTIAILADVLPQLRDPVHINGYSQPGASEAPGNGVAQLMIELDGSDLPISAANHGLILVSSGSIIEGLSIYGFPGSGIYISSGVWLPANDNIVRGNHIGVNWNATASPLSNSYDGVYIGSGATGNIAGGDTPAERNVISGNDWSGVEIWGTGTSGNAISGNYIGTNGAASNTITNDMHGVRIYGGATGNTVGGDVAGERNVLSGNTMCGVMLFGGVGSSTGSNTISGNYVGLNKIGGAAIPNIQGGVCIEGSATNTIGGDSAGERNVISGNSAEGVKIAGATSTGNVVVGNYIGLKEDGLTANPNQFHAVILETGASANFIGGSAPGEGNVIAGNDSVGIEIDGEACDGNVIRGNLIGTDATGVTGVGNGSHGIAIYNGADNTIIGGDETGQGNVISDNSSYGIVVDGASTGTVIQGNRIGTDATGTADLGNSQGVGLRSGATGNWIGGSSAAAGNLISGSGYDGIRIEGASTTGNVVAWNRIGTDATGGAPIANGQHGVFVWDGADDNTIGPSNIIAFNGEMGVMISGAETEGVVVTQNSIHDNIYEGIYHGINGNNDLPPPHVTGTALGSVVISGTSTCGGCTIEVFGNRTNDYRDGERYLGTTTAEEDGDWALTLGGLAYPYLTATATSSIDGTSQFSWSPFTATVRSLFLPLVLRQFP